MREVESPIISPLVTHAIYNRQKNAFLIKCKFEIHLDKPISKCKIKIFYVFWIFLAWFCVYFEFDFWNGKIKSLANYKNLSHGRFYQGEIEVFSIF